MYRETICDAGPLQATSSATYFKALNYDEQVARTHTLTIIIMQRTDSTVTRKMTHRGIVSIFMASSAIARAFTSPLFSAFNQVSRLSEGRKLIVVFVKRLDASVGLNCRSTARFYFSSMKGICQKPQGNANPFPNA